MARSRVAIPRRSFSPTASTTCGIPSADTPTPPQGARRKCTDTIPSADWDLSDIWYATSEDGFTWKEQGVAVPRPPKPNVGWRSVTTTDILVWEGKYYLYYQGFMEASGTRGD